MLRWCHSNLLIGHLVARLPSDHVAGHIYLEPNMSLEFHVSLKFQVSPKLHISLWSFGAPQILWIFGVWHFSGAIVLSACWTFGLVALDGLLVGDTWLVTLGGCQPQRGLQKLDTWRLWFWSQAGARVMQLACIRVWHRKELD